jgi:predicted ribosomally synthesized peptide with nif11-like leader
MSQMHIEKFYEIAANDQALLGQLIGDTSSPEQFVEKAVAAAKERGLNFSAEEANTWIATQQATKANDELSDTQLEGVAGGKGGYETVLSPAVDGPGEVGLAGYTGHAAKWFKSWWPF